MPEAEKAAGVASARSSGEQTRHALLYFHQVAYEDKLKSLVIRGLAMLLHFTSTRGAYHGGICMILCLASTTVAIPYI
jgi:hypothetical protein